MHLIDGHLGCNSRGGSMSYIGEQGKKLKSASGAKSEYLKGYVGKILGLYT